MDSGSNHSEQSLQKKVKSLSLSKWERLSEKQKSILKKGWGIITYKWKWQIALNTPYLAIFCLDRTVPAVHKFDMDLLTSITSLITVPDLISNLIGIS